VADKVQTDPIVLELQRLVDLNAKHLDEIKKIVDSGALVARSINEPTEKLAGARIDLARTPHQRIEHSTC
jgi:hypothetical protein